MHSHNTQHTHVHRRTSKQTHKRSARGKSLLLGLPLVLSLLLLPILPNVHDLVTTPSARPCPRRHQFSRRHVRRAGQQQQGGEGGDVHGLTLVRETCTPNFRRVPRTLILLRPIAPPSHPSHLVLIPSSRSTVLPPFSLPHSLHSSHPKPNTYTQSPHLSPSSSSSLLCCFSCFSPPQQTSWPSQ